MVSVDGKARFEVVEVEEEEDAVLVSGSCSRTFTEEYVDSVCWRCSRSAVPDAPIMYTLTSYKYSRRCGRGRGVDVQV